VKIIFLKIEMMSPAFFGTLFSLALCARIAVFNTAAGDGVPLNDEPEAPVAEMERSPSVFQEYLEDGDFVSRYYRDPDTRDRVVNFFTEITGSPNVAAVILSNASVFNIPVSLAFALCWEESRFTPNAVNVHNKNETIDRGLFQLNSRSFPNIAAGDFYNPSINAWYGMGHLRWCLDTGGTEVAALAMYNAGTGRVRSLGAPKNTLDYIHRILRYKRRVEDLFFAEIIQTAAVSEEVSVDDGPVTDVKKPLFMRLSPLSGR
jgi:hypothetical protein